MAQELVPRAYLITPKGSNAITLSYSWNSGQVAFDPSVPIEDAKGRFQTQVLSYYHSFGVLRRSGNIVVSLPYAVGNFEATVVGVRNKAYRSGLADGRVRFSMNLRGGPAMRVREFLEWREKILIGASFTVVVPIGQNDPARAVNTGTNRWAVKPEMGLTKRWGRLAGEVYGGVWFFGTNPRFFPGQNRRSQHPMAAVESHLAYYFSRRLWASFDANFWGGGSSEINGVAKRDQQRASRVGVSAAIPVNRHQSFKAGYSRGAYISIGGDYQTLSLAWQYSWLSKPK